MSQHGNEFVRRSGHRFNVIIRSLPMSENKAVPMGALHEKLLLGGYRKNIDQLTTDVGALVKRGEVASGLMGSTAVYWATDKAALETRKRLALIRLHNVEISEADLVELERLLKKDRPRIE